MNYSEQTFNGRRCPKAYTPDPNKKHHYAGIKNIWDVLYCIMGFVFFMVFFGWVGAIFTNVSGKNKNK